MVQELDLKGEFSDLSNLYKVTKGKMETMIEMFEVFKAQVEDYNESMHNAIDNNDWVKIAFVSHRFKSSFLVFGVTALTEKFEKVHHLSKEQNNIVEVRITVDGIMEVAHKCIAELNQFVARRNKNPL